MQTTRRAFLQSASTGSLFAGSLLSGNLFCSNPISAGLLSENLNEVGHTLEPVSSLLAENEAQSSDELKICIFTKPLQELDFQQLAELLSRWPVSGVEATIRKGGQIEPSKAVELLPRLHESLMARDRHFMILATDINRVEDADTETVLKTASKLGIRYFRMAYYKYLLDKPILPQLATYAKHAKRLSELCGSLNMTALYQNHAGSDYVGAAVWDLVQILQELPRERIAVALDIRHTTVEATAAWPQAYAVARPHLGALFVKDAIFEKGVAKDVPLGGGLNARKLFDRILRDGLPGPISLHMEHIDHSDPKLLDQRIEATTRDITTLRSWIAARG